MRLIKLKDTEDAKTRINYVISKFDDIREDSLLTIPSTDIVTWKVKIEMYFASLDRPHLLVTMTDFDIVSIQHPNIGNAGYETVQYGRYNAIDLMFKGLVSRQKEFIRTIDTASWKQKPLEEKHFEAYTECVTSPGAQLVYIEQTEYRPPSGALTGYTVRAEWFKEFMKPEPSTIKIC